ncbi:PREDICTED: uncharacterized protein LOC108691771 [Atta colombica]|uniref:uncharacterized protein LOC108691771 n=1 Tax=Atta colombica TaxID=520822 RepID=UPI00084BD6C5|nr:PREDICTED: uncharacterized protein LOC108691771 [Atta colombica]
MSEQAKGGRTEIAVVETLEMVRKRRKEKRLNRWKRQDRREKKWLVVIVLWCHSRRRGDRHHRGRGSNACRNMAASSPCLPLEVGSSARGGTKGSWIRESVLREKVEVGRIEEWSR